MKNNYMPWQNETFFLTNKKKREWVNKGTKTEILNRESIGKGELVYLLS